MASTRCAGASPSPPAQGRGEHWVGGCCFCWCWEQPPKLLCLESPRGLRKALPGRLARGSPKAPAAPPLLQSPCPPGPRQCPPSHCTPKPQGWGIPTRGCSGCDRDSLGCGELECPPWAGVPYPDSRLHGGQDRRTEGNEDPDPEDAYRAQLFFSCCFFVVASTVIQSREIYIYILYIYFLNYTINVQKTGVHC